MEVYDDETVSELVSKAKFRQKQVFLDAALILSTWQQQLLKID
jgi:hypothetical protein